MNVRQLTKLLWLTALCASAATASAQEFNIDVNAAAGTPTATYGAAAGNAGNWASVPAVVPLAPLALTDVNGAATAVTIEIAPGPSSYNGLGAWNWNNPGTAGDDQALMDDILDVGGGFPAASSLDVTVKGLAAKTYDVYVYSFAPDNYLTGNGNFAWNTKVTITGATTGTQTSGSLNWPGSQQQGATYTKHTVTIAGGADLEILLESDTSGQGGFGSLNGLQILESTGAFATYCAQTKPTSVAGCTATLTATNTSLATGVWTSTNIPRDAGAGVGTSLGIYIYTNGVGIGQSGFSASVPFGTLCLAGFKRSSPACTPALLPGAQPGVCNAGPMTTAVNCSAGALGIAVGDDVNAQLWYRDPTGANAGNANFSNAIFYTVQ